MVHIKRLALSYFRFPIFTVVANLRPIWEAAERVLPRACCACSHQLQVNFQTNEMLDRTVGVRVRQNGGLGSSVTYNLNGMSGESVRIFIDGIPISTYGAYFNSFD